MAGSIWQKAINVLNPFDDITATQWIKQSQAAPGGLLNPGTSTPTKPGDNTYGQYTVDRPGYQQSYDFTPAGSSGGTPSTGGSPQAAVGGGLSTDQLNTLYGGSGGSGSAAASAKAQRDAENLAFSRGQYEKRYGAQQAFRGESKQFATDQFNTARQRGQEQRGVLGADYAEQRGYMQQDLGTAQQGLTGAYGSRGLGDSSFALKAQANAQQSFDRNLSFMNKEEAAQYKEIDQYLADLDKQRDFQLKELTYEDFESTEDCNEAMKGFEVEKANIQAQREQIQSAASQAASSIGGMTTTEAYLKFASEAQAIVSAAVPEAKKRELLSSRYREAGKQDPEREADYHMSWSQLNPIVQDDPSQAGAANDEIEALFGIRPFSE